MTPSRVRPSPPHGAVVDNGFVGQYGAQWGPIFAAVVLATLPMLVAFAVLQGRALDAVRRGFRR